MSMHPTPEGVKMHPKSERFHQVLKELGELHNKKQKDYGRDDDPFANITASKDWSIRPVVGALLRMNDKVRRLQAWIRNGNLANESAEDSLRDIAVYAIIALVELENEQENTIKYDPAEKYLIGGTMRARIDDSRSHP